MQQIKAVINDIDGNLLLTEEPCWHLENAIYAAMNIQPMTHDLHVQTWGMRLGDAIPVRSQGKANVEKFWQLFPGYYQEFVDAGRVDAVTDEVLETLRELRLMGLQQYALTSRTYAEMTHLMDPANKLAAFVDAFYYKENMQYHKPDPRASAHIEELHGLKPEECVYVGDQPGDAAAAKGAGLFFIANLEEGLRTREDFTEFAVDDFVDTFAGVPAAIRQLNARLQNKSKRMS
jgi:phosphoglycolate phosphatase